MLSRHAFLCVTLALSAVGVRAQEVPSSPPSRALGGAEQAIECRIIRGKGKDIQAEYISPKPSLCLQHKLMRSHFDKLKPAAERLSQTAFGGGDAEKGKALGFRFVVDFSNDIEEDFEINAHYSSRLKHVWVNTGFLYTSMRYEDGAVFVLAHELGHAMQDHLGVEYGSKCDRSFEAQADVWALEILKGAGYPADSYPSMVDEIFNEMEPRAASQEELDRSLSSRNAKCRRHPVDDDRYVNALLALERSKQPSRSAALERLGGRSPEGKDFDGSGTYSGEVPQPAAPPTLVPRESILSDGRMILAGPAKRTPGSPPIPVKAPQDPKPASENGSPMKRSLLGALNALGAKTSWASDTVRVYLSASRGSGAQSVMQALADGIDKLSPSPLDTRARLKEVTFKLIAMSPRKKRSLSAGESLKPPPGSPGPGATPPGQAPQSSS